MFQEKENLTCFQNLLCLFYYNNVITTIFVVVRFFCLFHWYFFPEKLLDHKECMNLDARHNANTLN